MPSRRQIREAAIQFLYCADIEGGASPAELREPFWQFLTETDRKNLSVATFRTVQHLAHGRTTRLVEFVERSETAKAHLTALPAAESLLADLNRLLALESSWSISFGQLDKTPKAGEDQDVAEELDSALSRFFEIDRDLAFNRQKFLTSSEDFPNLKAQLEALNATIRRLQRISDRIRMVESPEKFPEQADLTKIRQSKADITALRTQTDALVDAVLAAKTEIDEKLFAIVENYSPERIDPVDRAVLRLGTYELTQTDTPQKVIINEAIELAKRFGTTDSKRFVNGMLDSVAKSVVATELKH
jgi:transcription antitermination protein NusB